MLGQSPKDASVAHTTLGEMQPGQRLNLEIDLMARYAARLLEAAQR